MCGIAGVKSFSPEDPIRADQIIQLLLASEHRGNDATGIALQDRESGKIVVLKKDSPASSFVQRKFFEEFLNEHLSESTGAALLHTRYATRSGVGDNGTPAREENNHPMWKGLTAVTHNGCIQNHESLFNRFKLERSCDTDSDILRALLDDKGLTQEGIRALDLCSGSVALAAVSEQYPGHLLLAKSGSPLIIGAHRQQIVWASEKKIVYAGLREYKKVFGFWPIDDRRVRSIARSSPRSAPWGVEL